MQSWLHLSVFRALCPLNTNYLRSTRNRGRFVHSLGSRVSEGKVVLTFLQCLKVWFFQRPLIQLFDHFSMVLSWILRKIQIWLDVELDRLIYSVVGLLFFKVARLHEHGLLHSLKVAWCGLIRAGWLSVAGALVLVLLQLHLRGMPFMGLYRSLLGKVTLHTGFNQQLI